MAAFTTSNWLFQPTKEIGAKSAAGSNGRLLRMAGMPAMLPELPNNSVCPSGVAFATSSAPIAPSAPGRLSMITVCPSDCVSDCAKMRPAASVGPPAGKPMTKRTGREG